MIIERIRRALSGISGVHVTAYAASGGIDSAATTAVVDRMAAAGIHNIVSAGNTAEFFALSRDEISRVHEAAVAGAAGRAPVTAAVGRSLTEAIALARAAEMAGADAIIVHQPLDPFAAPRAQARYFIEIAESSALPTIAYVRSDLLSVDDLVSIATHPNIAGVKFASTNLMLLAQCLRATRNHPAVWVCGLAESWAVPFYAMGTRGFTSGLVNLDPQRSLAIWAALEAGNFPAARKLVDAIAPFETMRTKFNHGANVTVVKEALKLLGVGVGAVRLPGLPTLDEGDRELLRRMLGDWGLKPFQSAGRA